MPSFVGPYATILAREDHPDREEVDRRSYRRGVRLVTFWFAVAGVAAVAFIVFNFVGDLHKEYYTPVLGICIGLAMAGLGFGLVIWNKRLMPDEEAVQERHPLHSSPDDVVAFEEDFVRGYQETGIGRHKVLRRTLLAAAGLLGLAPLAMLFNLGPLPHGELAGAPGGRAGPDWPRGTASPCGSGISPIGGIATVYPAIPDQNGKFVALTDNQTAADSTVMLIRLRPGENQPVPGPGELGGRGPRRLLEDLHARRLPGRAVRAADATPALPVPPVDVPGHRALPSHLRSGRPAAAAAADRGGRGRLLLSPRVISPSQSARRGGAAHEPGQESAGRSPLHRRPAGVLRVPARPS